WRDANGLKFLRCACRFTENNEAPEETEWTPGGEPESKRLAVKLLIKEMKKTNPFVESNIFKSVENVNLSTVIAYKKDGVVHRFTEEY
ncbi:MAG: hypothetical protein IKF16_05965, partial [Lachnospiraceae bacterium]|nr:hypothetical protein [Lachnospiraceae bacterium]